jgi:type II secretory pathway pseudopilin PulG
MMALQIRKLHRLNGSRHAGEEGWALLGLLLALGVMSIVLASSIVPNVQMQVQRDKELEMLYRGEQMAQGIARYYNGGALRGIQLLQRPPYGYLLDLSKLRDGVIIRVNELKFVRPSAMMDPVSSAEWEPVRARDPRIMPFLQAWAAQTLIPIPSQYLLLAGPPTKSVFGESGSPSLNPQSETRETGPIPPIINPANPGNPQTRPGQNPNDPDNDPDNDQIVDPLARLFDTSTPGQSNAPIVGVAPKKKGKAANSYFGLEHYEEWLFIYIPTTLQQGPGIPAGPGQQIRRPQISQ